ncbi:MAG: hypothetical protein ACLQAT_18600 [Candidatus Binataceae bacterium]
MHRLDETRLHMFVMVSSLMLSALFQIEAAEQTGQNLAPGGRRVYR